jgi:Family of unknown function (DUF5752)
MTKTKMVRTTAVEPFQFFTVAHVTRIGDQKAGTARELVTGIERCSDESIYYHMVEALDSEEGLAGKASNDFAKWAYGPANCGGLAELLASLDERYYTSIEEMRNDLRTTVSDYIAAYPECADEAASSPFCFCEGLELNVPLNQTASTLKELRRSIEEMSNESFYLHFVATKARLAAQQSNDFSIWLSQNLGLDELAMKINEIDLTENTLAEAKEKLLQLINSEPDDAEPNSAAPNNP